MALGGQGSLLKTMLRVIKGYLLNLSFSDNCFCYAQVTFLGQWKHNFTCCFFFNIFTGYRDGQKDVQSRSFSEGRYPSCLDTNSRHPFFASPFRDCLSLQSTPMPKVMPSKRDRHAMNDGSNWVAKCLMHNFESPFSHRVLCGSQLKPLFGRAMQLHFSIYFILGLPSFSHSCTQEHIGWDLNSDFESASQGTQPIDTMWSTDGFISSISDKTILTIINHIDLAFPVISF